MTFIVSIDDYTETVRISISPSIDKIKRAVCAYYGITKIDIESQRRTLRVLRPRHIAMYLAGTLTRYSNRVIGMHFGHRDESTVYAARCRMAELMQTDHGIAKDIARLRELIG